ncbi:MAG: hypothetical protein ACHREM_11145 [Polyangiales bacterium]
MIPHSHKPSESDDLARLLEAIGDIVRRELEAARTAQAPTFVDKTTSGLGPSVFLAAARAGEFDTFRVGKRFVARAADVLAFIERQRITPRERVREHQPRIDEFDVQLVGRTKRHAPNRVAGSRRSSER